MRYFIHIVYLCKLIWECLTGQRLEVQNTIGFGLGRRFTCGNPSRLSGVWSWIRPQREVQGSRPESGQTNPLPRGPGSDVRWTSPCLWTWSGPGPAYKTCSSRCKQQAEVGNRIRVSLDNLLQKKG